MVKYTRYQYGYPTMWSHWMYPPKGVGTIKYIKTAVFDGFNAQKPNIRSIWPMGVSMVFFLWVGYKVSTDWGKDSKFNVSLKSENGNWLYGPPCPKAVETRRVEKIMHAPHL